MKFAEGEMHAEENQQTKAHTQITQTHEISVYYIHIICFFINHKLDAFYYAAVVH